MELRYPVAEEADNLVGGSDASVDVGFGCLGAHLLRRSEVTAFKLGELSICIGLDVRQVLQVLALLHELDETGFVDDFLAGCVDEDAALLQLAYEVVVDALLRLGRCGNVERHDVARLEEFFLTLCSLHACSLDGLSGAVSVVSGDFHVEALSHASHVATNVTEGEDAKLLALQLCAAGAVEEVADAKDKQTEDKLSHAVGVLARCVHGDHVVSRSCCEVDVVVTCTGTHHNLQLLGSVEHLSIHLVRADNHGIDIFHCIEQLAFLCVFLE